MKKKVICAIMCLSLILAILPLAASAASDLTVGGNEISATGYYQMTSPTTVSEKMDEAPAGSNYFHWDDGENILTLYGVTVGGKGIRYSDLSSLTIVLAEGTINTVTVETGSALVSEYSTITIQGKGTLNATGQSNGAWISNNFTIQDGATVNLVGQTNSGYTAQYGSSLLTVKADCKVTFTGGTYGASCQNGTLRAPVIKSPNVTFSGDTAAVEKAPNFEGVSVIASASKDGSNPVVYDSSNVKNYKWVATQSAVTPPTTTTPTTQPTTVSTTASTTASTTVSTTIKPTAVSTVTTATTTVPTTAPTVGSTTATTIAPTVPVGDPTTEPTGAPVDDPTTVTTTAPAEDPTTTVSTAAPTEGSTTITTSFTTNAPTTGSDSTKSEPDSMLWLWIVLGVAVLGIAVAVIMVMKKKSAK